MEQGPRSTQTLSDFLKELRDQLRGAFPETYWVTGETPSIMAYPTINLNVEPW